MGNTYIFVLYVTACYLAILVGGAIVDTACYKRIARNLTSLESKGIVKRLPLPPHLPSDSVLLQCAQSEFSSEAPKKLLIILPGLFLFLCVLLMRTLLQPGNCRGFLILFAFAVVTIITNSGARYFVGLGFKPTTSILLVAFFSGALFWWIDSFIVPDRFENLLAGIIPNVENLKILYDHNKNCATLMITIFLAICITFVWNVSGIIKEQYTPAGISQILTGWIIWITFWPSLGLLGGIGAELGKRIVLILNSLK